MKNKNMKCLISLCVFLLSLSCIGQKLNIQRLQAIINKGICKDETRECIKDQIKYIKSCEELGDHYYSIKNYDAALKYYTKVADLNVYTDGELQDDEVIKFRNSVSLKAGKIYYYGIGVKKNIEKAFNFYYRVPIFYSLSQRNKYSSLFFGDTLPAYKTSNTKSIFEDSCSWGINPFFLHHTNLPAYLSPQFKKINLRMKNDSTLQCSIELSYGMLGLNTVNQSDFYWLWETLKASFDQNLLKKISFSLIPSTEGFGFKSFTLPKLSIKLNHL